MTGRELRGEYINASLKSTDQAVLKYLRELARITDGETCTASIIKVATACDISERQVQISTRRLINAGLLQRVAYDFSNSDRSKRGTVYKVLMRSNKINQPVEKEGKKRSIKFLLFWSED